jgi:outer membrane usher protein
VARLCLTVFLCLTLILGQWQTARADDDRVYLDLSVNGVAKLATLAILRGDDVLMPLADLRSIGAPVEANTAQTLYDQAYLSLKSLHDILSFSVDISALMLRIDLAPSTFKKQSIDLSAGSSPTGDPVYNKAALLNYGLHFSENQRVTGSLDGRFNLSPDAVVEQTGGLDVTGVWRRDLTSLTFEVPRKLERLIVGDSTVGGADFSGSAVVGGIDFRRAFDQNPYLVTFPLPATQTTILQPSQALLYLNGALVKTIDLAPGVYDLQDLPLRTGLAQAQLVIKNAFGQQTVYTSSLYSSSTLLKAGLTDFHFGTGFLRVNEADVGDTYGPAVASGVYRIGLTSRLTLGANVEAQANNQVGAGFSLDTIIGKGVLHGGIDRSREAEAGGLGTTVSYTTVLPHDSLSASFRTESPSFTQLGLSSLLDRPIAQTNVNVSHNLSKVSSISASYEDTRNRDSGRFQTSSLQYTETAGNGSLTASIGRVYANGTQGPANQISLFYTRRLNGRDSTLLSLAPGPGNSGSSLQFQHTAQSQLDTQYQVTANAASGVPLSGTLHLGLSQIAVDATGNGAINGLAPSGSLDLSGVIVAANHILVLSQPIHDAFAIVHAPGVINANVTANNVVVGKTDNNGNAVIGTLNSYQANKVGLSTSGLAYNEIVDGNDRSIVPGYHGVGILNYSSRTIHDVTGDIRLPTGPVVYGTVEATGKSGTKISSPTDDVGRFYFSDLVAGTYAATAIDQNGTSCAFRFTVPDFKGVEYQLGHISCAARP